MKNTKNVSDAVSGSTEPERKFGFLTATGMVVGIVIGSGIFFKTDDILKATGGDVWLGILAWVAGAVGIIFGGLTIAQLAARSDKVGGIIAYSEQGYGTMAGYLVGWYQIVIYNPALVAIVTWVAGLYTSILFGIEPMGLFHWSMTLVYLVGLYTMNILKTRWAGKFQWIATVVKLIPLFLIAVLGMIFGKPMEVLAQSVNWAGMAAGTSALVAVAFAYDGWIVSTSISHEVKNARKTMPLALTVGPLVVMVVYVSYFLAMNATLGSAEIMKQGDGAVGSVATMFFGPFGAKLVMIAVVISVLGTSNGLTLASIRMPYALGVRGQLPFSRQLSRLDGKADTPFVSGLLAFALSLVWLLVHYLSTSVKELGALDISSIPIILNYLVYVALYIYVMRLAAKGEIKGIFKGWVFPLLAIAGAGVVIYGGFKDPLQAVYLSVSIGLALAGLLIYRGWKQNRPSN